RDVRSPSTSPSATSALVATSVAVSNARISILVNRDKPALPFAVGELHGSARRGENPFPGLGPLHEDDRVVEVRLEIPPLRGRDAAEAEQVEVGDLDAAAVAVADGEGRARHGPLDAEGAAGAAHEGRLAGTELPGARDHVTGLKAGG